MILRRSKRMKYVPKSAPSTGLKALQRSVRRTLSSGAYASLFFCSSVPSNLDADYVRHVDGHDFMYAVSELMDNAREAIFILVRT
jgi:hypothetical protein